jgi:hypothetical protein
METALPDDWQVSRTEPIDPLPFLYRWDKIYHENIAKIPTSWGDKRPIESATVRDQDGIWIFEVNYDNEWPIIPLLAPDQGEKLLIRMLQDAFMNGKRVKLATRQSPFFENRLLIVGARVYG